MEKPCTPFLPLPPFFLDPLGVSPFSQHRGKACRVQPRRWQLDHTSHPDVKRTSGHLLNLTMASTCLLLGERVPSGP